MNLKKIFFLTLTTLTVLLGVMLSTNDNAHASEKTAKNFIANVESGGQYGARNGIYIGKYQLSSYMLKGNFSPRNQEKTANRYVYSKYGSWTNAANYWKMYKSF